MTNPDMLLREAARRERLAACRVMSGAYLYPCARLNVSLGASGNTVTMYTANDEVQ